MNVEYIAVALSALGSVMGGMLLLLVSDIRDRIVRLETEVGENREEIATLAERSKWSGAERRSLSKVPGGLGY
jgi:hypothetical protein